MDELKSKIEELEGKLNDLSGKVSSMSSQTGGTDDGINHYLNPDSTKIVKRIARKPQIQDYKDDTTVTFLVGESNIHDLTLGGNRILAILGAEAGRVFAINLKQDATGSRTVTWFSGISWFGGVTPTLTTTASKIDSFGFLALTTTTFLGYVMGQNA